MIWELFVCIASTWAGCAAVHVVSYPNEESCYRALASAVKAEKTTMYCRPKEKT